MLLVAYLYLVSKPANRFGIPKVGEIKNRTVFLQDSPVFDSLMLAETKFQVALWNFTPVSWVGAED